MAVHQLGKGPLQGKHSSSQARLPLQSAEKFHDYYVSPLENGGLLFADPHENEIAVTLRRFT